MIEFEGQLYFDDRLYVYSLCRAKVEEGPDETVGRVLINRQPNADLDGLLNVCFRG